MHPQPLPLVLLFGPSGAGKSTLCSALAATLHWLHVDTDPYSREAGAIAAPQSLARAFLPAARFDELATELRAMAAPQHRGVIVSFVSHFSPGIATLDAAQACGLIPLYLFGGEQECLRAFLQREARTGRGLTEAHWHRYSDGIYEHCRQPGYARHLLPAFRQGLHRPLAELVAEVEARAAGRRSGQDQDG